MVVDKSLVGKILYGLLFCVALPVLFYWWSTRVHIQLTLPPLIFPLGVLILIVGVGLVGMAMWSLWKVGKGLPMNAYPPSIYVRLGAYNLFRHPIYFGFCIACVGASIVFESATGFYFISPIIVLLCVALVLGYEARDINARFDTTGHEPFFSLPSQRPLTFSLRCAAFACAFIPWIILYELLIFLGVGDQYINTMMEWESQLPVIELAEIPYLLTYFFVGLVPFILNSTATLRRFVLEAWLLTLAGIFIQCVLPFYAEPRSFNATTSLGQLIEFEKQLDGSAAAFPSFHVIWALLAMRSWNLTFPRKAILFRLLASLIILSCIFTGIHSTLDVIAAIALYLAVDKKNILANVVTRWSERMANSWEAWHIGPLRVINHSIYAGLAAILGVLLVGQFGIGGNVLAVVTICSVVGGAVWAQIVEGSKKMLRPFGFYGALIGGIIGVFISSLLFDSNLALTFAAFAIGSTITQAVGRLRCLVQGCCHGRLIREDNGFGIRYFNQHSRVCLSGLGGKTIHNTQLYSIISNLTIATVLLRLVYAGVDASLVTGLFFVVSGIARFIEEGYRGEMQTPNFNGLSLYQLLAIACVMAGIIISAFPTQHALHFEPTLSIGVVTVAIASGLVWAFAMGMDFPKSSARFSRLTG